MYFFVLKKIWSTYREDEKTKNIDHKFKFLENTKHITHTHHETTDHISFTNTLPYMTKHSYPPKHSSRKIISPHRFPTQTTFLHKINVLTSLQNREKHTHINAYTCQYKSKYYIINITHIPNKKHSLLNLSRDQSSRKSSLTHHEKNIECTTITPTQNRLEEVKYH